MKRRIQLEMAVLAILAQAAMADSSLLSPPVPTNGFSAGMDLPERVLHFPPDRAVGQIVLVDGSCVIPEITREFHPGYVFAPPGRHLGLAQGEVRIPAGQCVSLHLGGKGVTGQQVLAALKSLDPNDVQDLDFLAPTQADDSFMPYIARLTGVTHFCPVYARFTPKSWALLASLPRLEHICTPYGLTDAEVAQIAKLPAVNEMEIVADRLTDAGLAALSQCRNLLVLHLEGTALMTDEGLKALATLPKLRHLRLSGPFTDKGLAYLATAPCLKVLWLETPRATEEALRPLTQIASLERLCLPYLDQISDRAIAYLQSMPKLKALGVGDAKSLDAGVAALASLPNLEILALKGSSSLTDAALKPLAAMPKLRALQIYDSRITEQGLASLAACKKLGSVQIKSSLPVSSQAVARLQADLPNLRTVDISAPEQPMQPRRTRPGRATLTP
jgi:hypothetical protein